MSPQAEDARPFAPACERNREPILEVLRAHLPARVDVFEIASGTGQHAVHFASRWPELRWQCSDVPERLDGIQAWLSEGDSQQLPAPRPLDALRGPWPRQTYDAVFTANSFHIMPWAGVEAVFEGLTGLLKAQGWLVVYGAFRVNGQFVSASGAEFDANLQARDRAMGLRDLEAVDALASRAGLVRRAHHAMPANNHCLVWQREA